MKPGFIVVAGLAALVVFLQWGALPTAAEEFAKEFPLTVESSLIEQGISASVAAVPPENAQQANGPAAIAFVTFEQAFQGELCLTAFDKDGTQVGQSDHVPVTVREEGGEHLTFLFDGTAKLSDAVFFLLSAKTT